MASDESQLHALPLQQTTRRRGRATGVEQEKEEEQRARSQHGRLPVVARLSLAPHEQARTLIHEGTPCDDGDDDKMKRWVPLESNPEVFTSLMRLLGVSNTERPFFTDVYSVTELFEMVPRPVHAVILCYPLADLDGAATTTATTATDAAPAASSTEANAAERDDNANPDACSPPLFFCRQTVSNACGAMALLHAVLNTDASGQFDIAAGSFLDTFREATSGMTPEQRAAHLERSEQLEAAHGALAAQGQSSAPGADEQLDMHFVTFVRGKRADARQRGKGHGDAGDDAAEEVVVYELDGRKAAPVAYDGDSVAAGTGSLLEAACGVIEREYIRKPEAERGASIRLTVMALCG